MIFCVVGLFAGCATHSKPKSSQSVLVTIISQKLKFSDMGFLDEFENKKTLQVYALGAPVFKIEFDEFVCTGLRCLSGEDFANEYISKGLYGDIMNDILSQKRLKIESKIVRNNNGFSQEAKGESYDISYRVSNDEIYFFERIGGFKFHLRFLD